MDENETTNPVDGADAPETEVETEVQDVEPQLDDDGNPIEDQAEPEDDEEIDLDDLKLKLPKSQAEKLKKAIMLNADYTRKTQEVAEERRALEAERTSVHQASEAELSARAQLTAYDQQLAYYGRIDWDTWERQAAAEFDDELKTQISSEYRRFQQMKDARGQLAGQLSQHVQQRTLEQQRETAKLLEEGRAVLARDIKGWSPELATSLLDTGTQYGFEKAEIEESFTDPRLVKVLHDAHQWRAQQQKDKKAQAVQTQQEVRPAAKVGGAAPKQGLDDRVSADEWIKRRNAQVRQRA